MGHTVSTQYLHRCHLSGLPTSQSHCPHGAPLRKLLLLWARHLYHPCTPMGVTGGSILSESGQCEVGSQLTCQFLVSW